MSKVTDKQLEEYTMADIKEEAIKHSQEKEDSLSNFVFEKIVKLTNRIQELENER